MKDGLPSSECYYVMQDSRKKIWIATDAGVTRYDGYSFTTYNNKKGLPDNTVLRIHEDRKGWIWFSTYSGEMAYYQYENDSIYSIACNQELSSIIKLLLVDFSFGSGDTLWVSNQGDAYVKVFPPEYKQMTLVHAPEKGMFIKDVGVNNFLYGLYASAAPLWRYPSAAFSIIDSLGKQYKFQYSTHSNPFHFSCIKTKKGYLFSDASSLFSFEDSELLEITDENKKSISGIIALYQDTKGHLWAGTLDRGVLSLRNFYPQPIYKCENNYFKSDKVSCILEDSEHGFWFSTTTNGVYYCPSLKFKYYPIRGGTCANKIAEMYIDDDKLHYITGCFSENVVDLKTNTISSGAIQRCQALFPFRDNLIVDDGQAWSIRYPKKKPVYLSWNGLPLSLRQVFDYRDGHLYGFSRGRFIFEIDENTGAAKDLVQVPFQIHSVCRQQETIYIGTKSGLYEFVNNELKFLGHNHPFLTRRLEAIVSSGNKLFIASKGWGVACYQNGKIQALFNQQNGLIDDICKCIAKDEAGNIWVGTNKGISCIYLGSDEQYHCSSLTTLDGLISNEINQIIPYKQHIYYATNNGLGYFDGAEALLKKHAIPLSIERFYVNDVPIDYKQDSVFRYDQNFIKIDYRGISFRSEGQLNYRYRLVGLDTNWSNTKNTSVRYTTLPPGTYQFEVDVTPPANTIRSAMASIRFEIRKPFWRTNLFIALSLGITICGIYFLFKRRIYLIKQKEQEKTKVHQLLAQYELRALRAQMNPHFIFNAINSIQSFVLKNEPKTANKYLTKFSRLIRSVLENSKHEYVTLSQEVKSLQLYVELECLRANFNFDYQFDIDEGIDADDIAIPPLTIQPFVENAILHGLSPLSGRRGNLRVHFVILSDRFLTCTVSDNGIGRQKASEIKQKKDHSRDSIGINITRERIDLLNQNKRGGSSVRIIDSIENGESIGTIVEVTIQYITNKYDKCSHY